MRNVAIGSLILAATVAFSYPAQVRPKKGTAPKPAVAANWREWGAPQRDFLTPSVGLFKAGNEK